MLSYHLTLLRKAPLSKLNWRILGLNFAISYLNFYDLALYVGYVQYLTLTLVPRLSSQQGLLFFSCLLLLSQFSKLLGFVQLNLQPRQPGESYHNFMLLFSSYLGLFAALHFFSDPGSYLLAFCSLRLLQSYAIGRELGVAVSYANARITKQFHQFIYYFILLASELGSFVSIIFNRNLIAHSLPINVTVNFWNLQFAGGSAYCAMILLLRYYFPVHHLNRSRLSHARFYYNIHTHWQEILIRAAIVMLHALLMFVVIFRMPSMLHLGFGWAYPLVNQLLILTGLMAFLGAYLMQPLTERWTPYQLLKAALATTIGIALIFKYYHFEMNYAKYCLSLLTAAFIYGAFVRLIPLYLLPLEDFHCHNRLTNRFVSYMLSYCLLGPFGLMIVDLLHALNQSFLDTGPESVLAVAALISLISLIRFNKLYSCRHAKQRGIRNA